ncbi:hypothetical protein GYMLUDRAFT_265786 [Collybiopsis luxurians FD-317 M1]|uniref:Uncharacterized protein n=1 Tax=Collybiopsis luxurians FD-317 M1 TaxID=944289 RepID=A0A0D0C9U5_9AGAR|nr:hypothetical protein GYMLUDRAFT_265786 [Collybiopsis luxurians FD-317 M1]
MTSEEQQTIASFAYGAYQDVIYLIVVFTGYGVFALGMVMALHALAAKSWTTSQIALTACLITISISFTLEALYYGILDLISIQYTLTKVIGSGQEGFEAGVEAAVNKILPLQYVPAWPATINVLLSDLIVVWRAWILCRNRSRKAILVALMIINICINIADCIWDDVEPQVGEFNFSILDSLSGVLTILVNILTTFLIGWETRIYLRFTARNRRPDNEQTRTGEILKLLVKSGAVFCLIQSVNTASALIQTYITVDVILSTINLMANVANAWYPVAVIILINNKT